jgi:hypothetical protein
MYTPFVAQSTTDLLHTLWLLREVHTTETVSQNVASCTCAQKIPGLNTFIRFTRMVIGYRCFTYTMHHAKWYIWQALSASNSPARRYSSAHPLALLQQTWPNPACIRLPRLRRKGYWYFLNPLETLPIDDHWTWGYSNQKKAHKFELLTHSMSCEPPRAHIYN